MSFISKSSWRRMRMRKSALLTYLWSHQKMWEGNYQRPFHRQKKFITKCIMGVHFLPQTQSNMKPKLLIRIRRTCVPFVSKVVQELYFLFFASTISILNVFIDGNKTPVLFADTTSNLHWFGFVKNAINARVCGFA